MIRVSLASSKKSSDLQRCMCSKTYCCYDFTSNKIRSSSKCLSKHVLEERGDGSLEENRRVPNEKVTVTSNKRRIRTNNNTVATNNQAGTTRRRLALGLKKNPQKLEAENAWLLWQLRASCKTINSWKHGTTSLCAKLFELILSAP